jgi:peroxiredoxin
MISGSFDSIIVGNLCDKFENLTHFYYTTHRQSCSISGHDRIRGLAAEVLAISTDDLSQAGSIARDLGVLFPVLYNPSTEVVKQFRVFNLLRDNLATLATFIIDRHGIIRWKYVGRSINDRPSTHEVLRRLELITG